MNTQNSTCHNNIISLDSIKTQGSKKSTATDILEKLGAGFQELQSYIVAKDTSMAELLEADRLKSVKIKYQDTLIDQLGNKLSNALEKHDTLNNKFVAYRKEREQTDAQYEARISYLENELATVKAKTKQAFASTKDDISTNRDMIKSADTKFDTKLSKVEAELKSKIRVNSNKILNNSLALNSIKKGGNPPEVKVKIKVDEQTNIPLAEKEDEITPLHVLKGKWDINYGIHLPKWWQTVPRYLRTISSVYRTYPAYNSGEVQDIVSAECERLCKNKFKVYTLHTSSGVKKVFPARMIEKAIYSCIEHKLVIPSQGLRFTTLHKPGTIET